MSAGFARARHRARSEHHQKHGQPNPTQPTRATPMPTPNVLSSPTAAVLPAAGATVLVAGATGNTGARILKQLSSKSGVTTIGGVRSPDKAKTKVRTSTCMPQTPAHATPRRITPHHAASRRTTPLRHAAPRRATPRNAAPRNQTIHDPAYLDDSPTPTRRGWRWTTGRST